jgi:catechol 2,3-dioxygenase-like lactoylglutathione lyase family enzyme
VSLRVCQSFPQRHAGQQLKMHVQREFDVASDPALGTVTVAQIGIVVRDIQTTARAWADILGLPMPEIEVTDPIDLAHTEYGGQPSPARAKLAFLRMGQVDVELIEPIDEPSTWNDHLDAKGEGLHHIAFRIKGMNERLAYLDAKGVALLQRGDFTGGRYAYVDATGTLGLILELLEHD